MLASEQLGLESVTSSSAYDGDWNQDSKSHGITEKIHDEIAEMECLLVDLISTMNHLSLRPNILSWCDLERRFIKP